MKLYLSCVQCNPQNHYIKEMEYTEEGYYYFECPNGHKNFVILQEEKFETLFQIGAHAIHDGYYREAISSFTASLERFYEFCVQIFCLKHNIDEKQINESCKFYKTSSERQFGSFLFLYLIEFKEIPFNKKTDDKYRSFRNNIIHNGKIPTKQEATEYGEYVKRFILTLILKLQQNYREELEKLLFKNLNDKGRNNHYNCPNTTMCQGNIISLVNGEIEKSLQRDLITDINYIKQLEYRIKCMHRYMS